MQSTRTQILPPPLCVGDGDGEGGADDEGADEGAVRGWFCVVVRVAVGEGCAAVDDAEDVEGMEDVEGAEDVVAGNAWRGV